MKLSATPEPKAEEQVERNRFFHFAGGVEAVGTGIRGGEPRVVLNDICILNMPVPQLFGLRGKTGRVGLVGAADASRDCGHSKRKTDGRG